MSKTVLTTGTVFAIVLMRLVHAQPQTAAPSWAVQAAAQYQIAPNVTYLTASNYESKMDIYWRRGTPAPIPTLVYFHGGLGCRREGRRDDDRRTRWCEGRRAGIRAPGTGDREVAERKVQRDPRSLIGIRRTMRLS